MQKKWQVAQKCHTDRNTTPQEVLGFKFAPDAATVGAVGLNGENHFGPGGEPMVPLPVNNSHVQAWVSQHYGNTIADLPSMNPQLVQSSPNANNNTATTIPRQVPSSPKPPPPQRSSTSSITYAMPNNLVPQPQQSQMLPQYPMAPLPPLQSNPVAFFPPPPLQSVQNHQGQMQNPGLIIYENFQGRKSQQPMSNQYDAVHLRNKKPPPPVPKRADSTHLSAHIVFN